jgi:hypothetical protein
MWYHYSVTAKDKDVDKSQIYFCQMLKELREMPNITLLASSSKCHYHQRNI